MTDGSAEVSPVPRGRPDPFPGLRPYGPHEAMFFFGRDGETDELVRLLRHTRLLTVAGASGSGKSSLVRAGLLPALRGGPFAEAGPRWRVATLRPGDDPVGNLARALAAPDVLGNEQMDALERGAISEAVLRRGSLGLLEAVGLARLPSEENLLLVVERFEDLFRVAPARERGAADDSAAFVNLLLESARQTTLPVYVVVVLRAGYLGDCARFRWLPEAINEGMRLVPRMTRDEAREAITGPAGVRRARVTSRLVERLLNDAGNDPRGLPAFQHAIRRTWEAWVREGREGEPLDFRHYEEAGGVGGSLSRHAEEVFEGLADDGSRAVAEKVFRALAVECGEGRGRGEVMKLVALREAVREDERDVAAVVEAFRREGRSFLRPEAAAPLTGESLVEISYEEVIHGWERLKTWSDGS